MRRGYIDWRHGQAHYRHGGEGPAVILLGGAPRSGGQFDAVIAALAARGFHAIAPDMPGFGQSDPAPKGVSIAEIAAFLPPLLDGLGIGRAHLFGLHSGAKVATAFAAAFPGRAAGLIVAGKSHSLVPDRETRNRTMRDVVAERYFTGGADRVDGPEALRGWAAAGRQLAKAWWDDALFIPNESGGDPAAVIRAIEAKLIDDLTARRTVRDFYEANFAFDFAGELARVAAPTLILEITSEAEDRAIGRQGEALRRFPPAATARTLPQVDGSGLFLHAGIGSITEAIAAFVRAHSP